MVFEQTMIYMMDLDMPANKSLNGILIYKI